MGKKLDRCSDCEIFKNKEKDENAFLLGMFCPIENTFTHRDFLACEDILSDNLSF